MTSERIVLDQSRIAACIHDMAAGLHAALNGAASVVVGVREGGDVLALRLAEQLRRAGDAVRAVGALDITLYRDDFGHRRHWPQVRASEIPIALDGETVVLVDDVLFTGRTIRAALDALLDYGRPERILLAVLVDRGFRQLPIQPDVVGHWLQLDRDRLCLARFREQGADDDRVTVTE